VDRSISIVTIVGQILDGHHDFSLRISLKNWMLQGNSLWINIMAIFTLFQKKYNYRKLIFLNFEKESL
jgi:hypothetical protein